VGYSRLMEEDEASTIRSLEDSKELMANLIQQYGGTSIFSNQKKLNRPRWIK
jgi:hypothetical protein